MTSHRSTNTAAIHWFRKGLRLHDNPALLEACKRSTTVYPVFCIDPYFAKPQIVGVNRYSFLLQSLEDLNNSLRKLGSRLYILKGMPEEQLMQAIDRWNINLLTFEGDTEPYAKQRDVKIMQLMDNRGVEVKIFHSHTLHPLEDYVAKSKGSPPTSYQSFLKLFDSMKVNMRELSLAPSAIPHVQLADTENSSYDVPTLHTMGYEETPTTSFAGGESAALMRLETYVQHCPDYVRTFAKPDTAPNSLEPSTTVLSPHLKFGCLSALHFYLEVEKILRRAAAAKQSTTAPPVSLHGQLLWREFFYLQSYITRQFDRMVGNAVCRQIPWDYNAAYIQAWKSGRTGYPFVDAIMHQLAREGWIHHLARHMVACFLTRGDLWQSWEEGVKVFDLYLLDSDWALNNGNWQWLSCSNFFYQYFRCYSPIAFGKKTDPEGLYIKKYLPQLAGYPSKYIYEPWKAPLSVQQAAGCVIGRDYPHPIVDHDTVSKVNMNRMKDAYAQQAHYRTLLEQQQGDIVSSSSSSSSSSLSMVANVGQHSDRHHMKGGEEGSEEQQPDEEINDDSEGKKRKRKAPSSRLITDFMLKPSSTGSNGGSSDSSKRGRKG